MKESNYKYNPSFSHRGMLFHGIINPFNKEEKNMSNLQEFKNDISVLINGTRIDKAQEKNICVCCKCPISINIKDNNKQYGNIYSPEGIREYQISGLCETCFDKIAKEIEE